MVGPERRKAKLDAKESQLVLNNVYAVAREGGRMGKLQTSGLLICVYCGRKQRNLCLAVTTLSNVISL